MTALAAEALRRSIAEAVPAAVPASRYPRTSRRPNDPHQPYDHRAPHAQDPMNRQLHSTVPATTTLNRKRTMHLMPEALARAHMRLRRVLAAVLLH